jgi:Flp pilus assembly pilin Flp
MTRLYALQAFALRAKTLISDRRGVTALEYGIIASILGLALIEIFAHLGSTLSTLFSKVDVSI